MATTHANTIAIVSGLPRSGTSMMMRMLEAGGMTVLADGIRTADEDNPRGYYEFERVKQVKHDKDWLEEAKGKVVKMVSALLIELPRDHHYKVIFMRRRMDEILASQRQMLQRQGKPADAVGNERMASMFEKHLEQITAWLSQRENFQVVYVDYNALLENPVDSVHSVNALLGNDLDTAAMLRVVDPALYRQRR